ncbi:MAG: hypothetical protein GY716_24965 [bacterium]|nr:hypothetical protein [bacterium]
MELTERNPIFVGFKLDSNLKRQLQNLSGPDSRYVSVDESEFLRLCSHGEDLYVGKAIKERLTTDRVDDVTRNILSILRRLCPDTRLPEKMEIWACSPELV